MFDMVHILISLFAFLFAIGILVTIHEFGHFWVARRLGVKVLRFSIGFGKTLWLRKDKQGTEFVLAAIPLGGFVKMLDEREGTVPPELQAFSFNRKSVWARFLVVLAGPLFNFLFAIVVYWLVYMIGITGSIPKIGEVLPNSIAAHAGMGALEEIISVDHKSTPTWQAVSRQLMERIGDKDVLEIQTVKSGVKHSYDFDLSTWDIKGKKPDLFHSLGIVPVFPPTPALVHDVYDSEPGALAGIKAGDLILTVNQKPISTWVEFTHVVSKSINKTVELTVKRNDQILHLHFKPRARQSDNGDIVGFAGLVAKHIKMPKELTRTERLGPIDAFVVSLKKTQEYIFLSFRVIWKMLKGELGLHTLSGPLTIAQGAGATVSVGFQYYLGFLALISISLGVVNLLPIPILDGGHLLYYVIEMITRKPVSEKIQFVGFKIGMLVLITLMSIAFYNDILRML